jgi:DNA repair exonuclease SbcCD ATPase subunit
VRSEFLKSPHHAAMALATLGVGFAAGAPLYLVLGAAAYVLGWIFLPDMPLFKNWVEARQQAQLAAAAQAELTEFRTKRDALLGELTNGRRQRYTSLADVCHSIERAAAEGSEDPRLRKLEELMWTFLRLLTIEQSLDQFIETEAREDVPGLLATAKAGVDDLTAEIAELQSAGKMSAVDAKTRLRDSRRELLATVEKRNDRLDQAKNNLALVISEQQRLDQQIKLIRADSIATKNASALSARIDATVENLEATNQWLSQMDQFRDILTDLPQGDARVGFGAQGGIPPPLPQPPIRGKERA